jgi:Galactose oxidase-like, Early set domain
MTVLSTVLLSVILGVVFSLTPQSARANSVTGEWSQVLDWPITAIHMSLLHTGHILAWSSKNEEPHLLDPTNDCFDESQGCFTPKPNPVNIFCAGHAHLGDGSVIVNGGHIRNHVGEPDTFLFQHDKEAQDWNWTEVGELPDTHFARWYPTLTTLADGRVLNVSGSEKRCSSGPSAGNLCQTHDDCAPAAVENCTAQLVAVPELFDPATRKWTTLDEITESVQFYPFNFVDPDGNVFFAGADAGVSGFDISPTEAATFSVDGAGVTLLNEMSATDGGSAVMFRPGQILKCGGTAGSSSSIADAETIDLTSDAQWHPTNAMSFPRRRHNLTMLPDGTVLVSGGTRQANKEFEIERTCGGTDDGAVCSENADCQAGLTCLKHPMGDQLWVAEAEIWNPDTGVWTTMADSQRPRMYHSTALLLPDGRVLSAGGGRGGGAVNDYRDAQIFSPPYLFSETPRPVIEQAPELIFYSQSFQVRSPEAADIDKVSLIRLGAVTHSFDQDARFVPLSFTLSGDGRLQVESPASPNIAPPGYYMLFLVSSAGVPSIARFIRILPPDPGRDSLYEYSAKIVCGVQSPEEKQRLAPGSYGTSINIHNPGPGPVRFFKKLALTFPPGSQRPGEVLPIGEDVLEYDRALQTDCRELRQRLVPTHEAPTIEGFLVLQSPKSLDVTGVYTTAALDTGGAPSTHSSIDIEQVTERRRKSADLLVTKVVHDCTQRDTQSGGADVPLPPPPLCDLPIGDIAALHFRRYTITVTNFGPDTATNVVLDDQLGLDLIDGALGWAFIWATDPIILPAGAQILETNQVDLVTSTMKIALPDLPSDDSHEIQFWAIALSVRPPGTTAKAVLHDTAEVESEIVETAPANNLATVSTQLVP